MLAKSFEWVVIGAIGVIGGIVIALYLGFDMRVLDWDMCLKFPWCS